MLSFINPNERCPRCGMELKGTGVRKFCQTCGIASPFLDTIKPVKEEERVEREASPGYRQGIQATSIPQEWLKVARAADQTEQNFAECMSLVLELGVRLNLPAGTVEEAGRLTKEAFKERLSLGKSMRVLVGSLVYAAARQQGYALTLDEIGLALRVNKREVSRCFRKCSRTICAGLPPPTPEAHLSKILEGLGFTARDPVSVEATKTLRVLVESNFTQGRNPSAIAAALVYRAARVQGVELTQRTVARESLITETTIRSICSQLESNMPNLLGRWT
ncbi:MAG: hypothetical protein OK452_09070 [Thaumarchaeota archaeon]|nr:hypothetical protein [Nitrososphaerota archaeon]